MPAPTVSTEWASDASALKTDPNAAKRDFGWSTTTNTIEGDPLIPDLQTQNGWQNAVHQWILYLNDNIGGGGGGTGKNYIINSDATVDATTGVDKTNTAGTFTVDRTTTASELPEETKGTAFKCSGDGSVAADDYIAWQIENNKIDAADGIPFSVRSKIKLIGPAEGDWELKVYSVTDSVYVGQSLIVASTGTYLLGFTPIPGDDYEFHLIATGASPEAIGISGIEMGPTDTFLSDAPSAWEPYTPSNVQGFTIDGLPTTGTWRLQWRRVGENCEIAGDFTAGTTTANEGQLELPNSYTINYLVATGAQAVGFAERQASSTFQHQVWLATHGDTYLNIAAYDNSASNNTLNANNGNAAISTGNRVSLMKVSVPVAEFANSNVAIPFTDMTRRTKEVNLGFSNTPTGWANPVGKGMAYADSTGQWRFRGNIWATISATTGTVNVDIDGVTFKNETNFFQPVTAGETSNSTDVQGYVTPNTPQITTKSPAGDSRNEFAVSFDVLLESQPTDDFVGNDSNFSVFTAALENQSSIPAYIPLPNGFLRLDSGNGHGSTNTKIRRWSNSPIDKGNAWAYADSATDGMSVTMNRNCSVFMLYVDNNSGGSCQLGLTVNSSQLTTNINSSTLVTADKISQGSGGTGIVGQCSGFWNFSEGDVLRTHGNGASDSTNNQSFFIMIEMNGFNSGQI